ncbi:MAG: DUF3368 domain-containing protein [bacterium]|nr:DUF3368 domain-containing protein [bacterium]
MKIVINATPLISLAIIDKLSLLDELFEEVYIPKVAFKGASRKGKRKAGVIAAWGENRTLNTIDAKAKVALELILDEGEAEVIVLAQEREADLVIIDEDKARKIARLNNLNVTGTIGILLEAKNQGKISQLKPLLDKLIAEGIYISEHLYNKALALSNEK